MIDLNQTADLLRRFFGKDEICEACGATAENFAVLCPSVDGKCEGHQNIKRASRAAQDPDKMPISGMGVTEAVFRAARWWDSMGRALVSVEANKELQGGVVRTGTGKAPGFVIAGNKVSSLPSGILNGMPFELLSDKEKAQVVSQWHDNFVLMPMRNAGELHDAPGSNLAGWEDARDERLIREGREGEIPAHRKGRAEEIKQGMAMVDEGDGDA